MFGDKMLYTRVGSEGRDQILAILIEKDIVTQYWAKENEIDGVAVTYPTESQQYAYLEQDHYKEIKLYQFTTKDEA